MEADVDIVGKVSVVEGSVIVDWDVVVVER